MELALLLLRPRAAAWAADACAARPGATAAACRRCSCRPAARCGIACRTTLHPPTHPPTPHSHRRPADYSGEETLSTLRYAARAKHIRNKPRVNEDPKVGGLEWGGVH